MGCVELKRLFIAPVVDHKVVGSSLERIKLISELTPAVKALRTWSRFKEDSHGLSKSEKIIMLRNTIFRQQN